MDNPTPSATAADTAPLNFVVDPTPSSDDHASSTDDGLLDTLTRVVDAFCWAVDGPRVAALAVLGQQRIVDALAAADVVAQLDGEHTPVRWAPDSPTVVCRAGCGAYPCRTRDRLDGRLT